MATNQDIYKLFQEWYFSEDYKNTHPHHCFREGYRTGERDLHDSLKAVDLQELWERFSFDLDDGSDFGPLRLMTRPQFLLAIKELTKPKEE